MPEYWQARSHNRERSRVLWLVDYRHRNLAGQLDIRRGTIVVVIVVVAGVGLGSLRRVVVWRSEHAQQSVRLALTQLPFTVALFPNEATQERENGNDQMQDGKS